MEDRKSSRNRSHSLIIENREKLTVSGVEHVNNYNSELIIVETVEGVLTIKGQDLDISKLNLEDGNVSIQGFVYSLVYSDREGLGSKGAGFLSRMFK